MADIKLNPDEIMEKLEPVGDAVAKVGKAVGEKAREGQKMIEEKAREAGKAVGEKAEDGRRNIESKAKEAGKAAGEKAKEVGKTAGDKARAAGKTAGDLAVEAGRNAGVKAKENHEKVQAKAKQAGREATSAVTPIIYVQYGEREFNCDELVERAKADYREKNKGGVLSCKLYVKPEENAVYYVISGKEGKIEL